MIKEALESVRKHTGEAPVEPAPSEAVTAEVAVEVEGAAGAGGPVAADSKEVEALKAQLELSLAKGREMMEKVKDSHEKMLRAVADLDNFKKRAAKEKEEIQKYGVEKLLKDFLPIIDNLDRALEHGKSATDLEGFREGVAMTRKLFEDTLGKHGIKSFVSQGQPFDPRFHEAMQQVETAELPPNHVVTELVRGYTLNERLVRPALVMVSKAPAAASKPAEGSEPPSGDA